MPFICLATNHIPDGTLQVLDLWPNESQKSSTLDPPGQTKYVNRVQNQAVTTTVAGITAKAAAGLSAYLLDKVQPGGLEQATFKMALAGVQAGDTLTVMSVFGGVGITFTAVAGAPANSLEFQVGADDDETAANLIAAITHADSITAMKALAGNGDDHYVHAAVAAGDANNIVTLYSRKGAAVALVGTASSALDVATNADPRIDLSNGGEQTVTDRLFRVNETWNTSLAAASAAIIARMDAGQALTLADVNTVLGLSANGATELTNAGGSTSVGVLTELLSILAGREYYLPASSAKFDNTYTWNPTVRGSFTRATTRNGTVMINGEIRSQAVGGDVVQIERKPIRTTYHSSALAASCAGGHLAGFAGGITLFPDSDAAPFISTWYQPGPASAQQNNVRAVTVYDDDGSVLA